MILVAPRISTPLFVTLFALCTHHSAVSRQLVSADDWTGIWRGTYVCAQGVTGLFLTVRRIGESDVTADFAFFAVPENPGVPKGEFDMTGRPGPQGNHLQLSPHAWITRPPHYLMVALDGDYDEASGEYSGRVLGPEASGEYSGRVLGPTCTRFILRRDVVG
jgi:hypothetical protein